MTGVDFNANAVNTKTNSGSTTTTVSCVNTNNWAVINQRMNAEGPAQDTFTPETEEPKPEKDPLFVRAKNALINLIKSPLGAKSSRIEFLENPIKADDGSYIISEPFDAEDLDSAQTAANKLYSIEKGRIERLTGETFAGVSAQADENGQYVATAEGSLGDFLYK